MSRLPILSCEGVSKAYGVQPLFEGLSFGLAEGDRVGLVGPNGSGKTTLLKVLAGMEPPDTGTRSQRRLSRLGYVPQDPTFPGDRTVEATLAAALPPEQRDGFETAGRIAAMLGRAGFHGSVPDGGRALRRVAQAAGHRPRAGGRSRRPPVGRADQPPRRGGHPVARGASADRGPGVSRGQPRPLLSGARRLARPGTEPVLPRRPLPGRGAVQRLPLAARRGAARAGGLSGYARQPGPARGGVAAARTQGADPQGAGPGEGGGSAHPGTGRGPGAGRGRHGRDRVHGVGASVQETTGGAGSRHSRSGGGVSSPAWI